MKEDTQLSLNPKEKKEEKAIRVIDGTMEVFDEKNREVDYIVLKMGGKTFSTNHKNMGLGNISGIKAKLQKVRTVGVGKQKNLWIKAVLTEGTNHQSINPIEIELNIYSPLKEKEFEAK